MFCVDVCDARFMLMFCDARSVLVIVTRISLVSQGTVYLYETGVHKELATNAGLNCLKASRAFEHPHLVKHCSLVATNQTFSLSLVLFFQRQK